MGFRSNARDIIVSNSIFTVLRVHVVPWTPVRNSCTPFVLLNSILLACMDEGQWNGVRWFNQVPVHLYLYVSRQVGMDAADVGLFRGLRRCSLPLQVFTRVPEEGDSAIRDIRAERANV